MCRNSNTTVKDMATIDDDYDQQLFAEHSYESLEDDTRLLNLFARISDTYGIKQDEYV